MQPNGRINNMCECAISASLVLERNLVRLKADTRLIQLCWFARLEMFKIFAMQDDIFSGVAPFSKLSLAIPSAADTVKQSVDDIVIYK